MKITKTEIFKHFLTVLLFFLLKKDLKIYRGHGNLEYEHGFVYFDCKNEAWMNISPSNIYYNIAFVSKKPPK